MTILDQLYALRDVQYAQFQAKLTPTVPPERFIGVRVPELRKLARKLIVLVEPSAAGKSAFTMPRREKRPKEGCEETKGGAEVAAFLATLPHSYYDEDMLHGLLLSEMKDYDASMRGVERFLPYVDNWAVCDIMSPKVFKKHKEELLAKIPQWVASTHTYTCRFGMEMLMTHFLDDDFRPELLEIPAAVRSKEYYVNMMTAWFFATALAKQWESALPYIEQHRLDPWVHNKTIQKSCESFRVSTPHKAYLKTLKYEFLKQSPLSS